MNSAESQKTQATTRSSKRFFSWVLIAALTSLAIVPAFTSYSQLWYLLILTVRPHNIEVLEELDSSDPISRYYLIRQCLKADGPDDVKTYCASLLNPYDDSITAEQGEKLYAAECGSVRALGFLVLFHRRKLPVKLLIKELVRHKPEINYDALNYINCLNAEEQFEILQRFIDFSSPGSSPVYWSPEWQIISHTSDQLWLDNPVRMKKFVRDTVQRDQRTAVVLALYFSTPKEYERPIRDLLRSRIGSIVEHNLETESAVYELAIANKLIVHHQDFDSGLPVYHSWLEANLGKFSTAEDGKGLAQIKSIANNVLDWTTDVCSLSINGGSVTHPIETYNKEIVERIAKERTSPDHLPK